MSTLTFENVSFSYKKGDLLLSDISLTLSEGKITGLMGPNGSGKTTLLKMALSELTPQNGAVYLDNQLLQKYDPKIRAQKMAYVSAEMNSIFRYTVEDIVSFGRFPYQGVWGKSLSKTDQLFIEEALVLTQTVHLRDRFFSSLSMGEKQLVQLAKAFSQDAKLLLLDEPITHLDLKHQDLFCEIMKRKVKKDGLTVLIVSHNLHHMTALCDEGILIKKGKFVCLGPIRDVLNEKQIRYTFYDD